MKIKEFIIELVMTTTIVAMFVSVVGIFVGVLMQNSEVISLFGYVFFASVAVGIIIGIND